MWNINGFSSSVLGDKSKNDDFLNHIKNNDFIFLTETWSNTWSKLFVFLASEHCQQI
jgi:hypothetical protein